MGRTKDKKREPSPGPSDYSPSVRSSLKQFPTYGMGTSVRKDPSENSLYTPGPGTYDYKNPSGSPQWKFGTGSNFNKRKFTGPGPGSYEVPSSLSKNAYSLLSRHQYASKRDSEPGPGQYSPTFDSKRFQYSFSKGGRDSLNKTITGPAPGSYNPNPLKSQLGNSCNAILDLEKKKGPLTKKGLTSQTLQATTPATKPKNLLVTASEPRTPPRRFQNSQ